MGFSKQEYWSGLPFPSPGDLPDPGTEPTSPTWQADSSQLSHLGTQYLCAPTLYGLTHEGNVSSYHSFLFWHKFIHIPVLCSSGSPTPNTIGFTLDLWLQLISSIKPSCTSSNSWSLLQIFLLQALNLVLVKNTDMYFFPVRNLKTILSYPLHCLCPLISSYYSLSILSPIHYLLSPVFPLFCPCPQTAFRYLPALSLPTYSTSCSGNSSPCTQPLSLYTPSVVELPQQATFFTPYSLCLECLLSCFLKVVSVASLYFNNQFKYLPLLWSLFWVSQVKCSFLLCAHMESCM